MKETPKYHLPDVRGNLRDRVLDLCIHRLWHDALELLQQNGFNHYDRDDLINFYGWAPARLPDEVAADTPVDLGPSSGPGVHAASPPADPGCGQAQPQHDQSTGSVDTPNESQTADPVAPTSTSAGSSGVTSQRVSNGSDNELRPARELLVNLCSARPTPPVAAPRESAVDSTHSSIDPSIQQSNPASLLSDLCDLINRYVVLPEMAAETLALWVVHTYAFTLREVTTYIGVVSPEKRCGKTTLLELLGSLAHEAIAAANISPPALFRVIEEARPTLIIDEADTFMQARDEMAGILNAGYRKGNAYVVRVAEGKSRKLATSCGCPGKRWKR